ncbi:hypothetical protein LAV78_20190 [Brucella intermedia]|uniref:hypothetical protein n=1 Tax=Brucella intermedia TaxID=94625 RepID=UPI001E5DC215|nr:hypothetical protein [Brucella intermedia]MCB4920842.1 hypothetical protein [Brucella intermedia]
MKSSHRYCNVRRHTGTQRIHGGAYGADNAAPPQYDPPTLPSAVYATLDDAKFPSMARKLLRANVRAQALNVYITTLGAYNEGDEIILVLDGIEIPVKDEPNGKHTITIEEAQQGLIQMSLPAACRLEERPYSLQYRFYSGILGNVGITSPEATFITDYTAPGGSHLARPEFDPEIILKGLDAEGLAKRGDQITALIPAYAGQAVGDIIKPEFALLVGETLIRQVGEVEYNPDGDTIITFTGDDIRENSDGLTEFRYYIWDLAGNCSQMSEVQLIDVFVGGAIGDLAPPLVPLYHSPKPLDESAARTPIYVDIPGNARLAAGDKILAYWGDTPLYPEIPITEPGLPVMFSIRVPYWVVQTEGNGTVEVTYRAFRSSQLLGEPADPAKVSVNLIQPGGPDPDPETRENEALGAPILHASGWKPGDPSNLITVEQSKEDATFIVPWLNTATPAVPSFAEHDQIDCFYVDRNFGTIEVTSNDVNNGKDLTIPVPATVIQDFGSGVMPIHYVASRTSADNNGDNPVTNSAISVSTDVTIESAGDFPGGGEPLPLPVFETTNRKGITYQNASAGVTISIPYYINRKVGDEVTISFSANLEDDGSGANIPQAAYTETKRVVLDDKDGPMKFILPPSNALYLYPSARGHLVYTAKNHAGAATSTPMVHVSCDTRTNPYPPS